MKNDVILACKYIIKHTVFGVQACYSGNVSDADVAAFENEAYDLIKAADEADIEEAYDECLECVGDAMEITSAMVLQTIGDKAKTPHESLILESVNIIKEL